MSTMFDIYDTFHAFKYFAAFKINLCRRRKQDYNRAQDYALT